MGGARPFTKILHPFIIKLIEKQGVKGTYLSIIKSIYNKHTANIMVSEEKFTEFQLNEEKYKGYSLSQLLLNIVVSILVRAKIEVKMIKELQIRKKKGKRLSIFICR